jgi:hypothetical protein
VDVRVDSCSATSPLSTRLRGVVSLEVAGHFADMNFDPALLYAEETGAASTRRNPHGTSKSPRAIDAHSPLRQLASNQTSASAADRAVSIMTPTASCHADERMFARCCRGYLRIRARGCGSSRDPWSSHSLATRTR